MIEWTLDALIASGIEEIAINTHHCPDAWQRWSQTTEAATDPKPAIAASESRLFWKGVPIDLFYEPVLLETGGGLKNIESWVGDEPLLVHNGDVFSTLPIQELMDAHRVSGLPATLAVRSFGGKTNVALNEIEDRVIDLRRTFGHAGTHLFTGIYCLEPELLKLIPAGEPVSIIPAFLELAESGRLGACVLDEGEWRDLGDRDSYLTAHQELKLAPAIHPKAIIHPTATISDSVVGPNARIGAGATIRDSVIWPNAEVSDRANLDDCIIYSDHPAKGKIHGKDC